MVTKMFLFPVSDFKHEADGTIRLKRKYGNRTREAVIIESDIKKLHDNSSSIPHTIKVKFK